MAKEIPTFNQRVVGSNPTGITNLSFISSVFYVLGIPRARAFVLFNEFVLFKRIFYTGERE